jgi:hypothetical protein
VKSQLPIKNFDSVSMFYRRSYVASQYFNVVHDNTCIYFIVELEYVSIVMERYWTEDSA